MGSLLFRTLVGALAGLAAWLLWEPSAPSDFYSADFPQWELKFIITLCAFIGLGVGAVNGWSKGSKLHALREGILGALFGILGGGVGESLGNVMWNTFHGAGNGPGVMTAAARLVTITPIGLCIGAGIGAATLSLRGMFQGAIGGAIGGAFAGAAFDPIGQMVGLAVVASSHAKPGEAVEVGGPSRAVLAVLLGGLIALFIGLAERVLRSAWVRLSLGRNEGKEWVIDRPQVSIGRSEGAQIPIFGDPSIAPIQAYILNKGGAYILADAGAPGGVLLNGQRISQAPLTNGAQIQVGGTVLQFLMKAGAAPQRGPEAYAMAYPVGGGYPGQPVAGGQMPVSPYGAQPQSQSQPAQPQFPQPGYGGPSGLQPTVAAAGPLQPTMMSPGMQPSAPTLVALDGPLAGQRFPVGAPIDLGRGSASVPMGYDTQASRRHATVAPSPNGVSVMDQGSTNGTFVNDQRVTQAEARQGDRIRVGQTTFRVE